MELSEILNYYSRRWAIECFFRDCKQLLELGKRQIIGPIGPLFKELADEQLLRAVMRSLWDRFRQILMLSSQLFSSSQDPEELFHFLDVLENSFTLHTMEGCAKL
ncbi:MAG: transposase [Desulfobulbus sp.]|nr:transposase [Desulfobulbus sp.]